MKKLMIAVAFLCAAVMANAATVEWKWGATPVLDGSGSTTKATTQTKIYFYNAMDYSQQTLLTAALGGATFASLQAYAVDSADLTSGKLSAYESIGLSDFGTYNEETSKGYGYMVVFDETAKKIMIGGSKESTMQLSESGVTQFTAPTTTATGSKNTWSYADSSAKDAFSTKGAGWYTVAPEPTSGLLLLIGMAGLALKRKRA